MHTRDFEPHNLGPREDWEGNNIAVECPVCQKVYLVSEQIHGGERNCPQCGKSKGMVKGGRKSGGVASVSHEAAVFQLGRTYSREVISERLGGSEVDFLPMVDGKVVCGCFTRDHNPEAPLVIVPGNGPNIRKSAEAFCDQTTPVPIFIKQRPNHWEYVGDFRAERSTTAPTEIAVHHCGSITPLADISRVIFLTQQ